MAKRNRRNRKVRTSAKLALQSVSIMQPPIAPTEAQVHICHSPIPTDGLTPMQRDLIREAARLQTCKAGTPIETTSITEQHSWGWTVYTWSGENIEAEREIVGLIGKTDERVCSNAYSRKLASNKRAVMSMAEAKLAKLKAMRSRRALVNDAIMSEIY